MRCSDVTILPMDLVLVEMGESVLQVIHSMFLEHTRDVETEYWRKVSLLNRLTDSQLLQFLAAPG